MSVAYTCKQLVISKEDTAAGCLEPCALICRLHVGPARPAAAYVGICAVQKWKECKLGCVDNSPHTWASVIASQVQPNNDK